MNQLIGAIEQALASGGYAGGKPTRDNLQNTMKLSGDDYMTAMNYDKPAWQKRLDLGLPYYWYLGEPTPEQQMKLTGQGRPTSLDGTEG